MSILVTGGAGYIGSHMVLALCDSGRDVVVLDDLSTGYRRSIPVNVPVVVGCVSDEQLVDRLIDDYAIDAIVHFAGSIVVPDSISDPLAYYLNNTVRSRSLIATAVKRGVRRFVFSSTAAVYGEASDRLLDEGRPLLPVSPYGASKLMTERMLEDAANAYGTSYVVLRYFNVAGADPAGRSGQSSARATHLIKIASQVALGVRASLEVYGDDYPTHDGTCVRDYVHVSDLVAAHVLALDHLDAGRGNLVANCGYGYGSSVLEVVDAVKRISGVDFPVVRGSRRNGDPASLVAAPHRANEILNWEPKHNTLDEIVTHALAWERRILDRGVPM
ncbi:UDP-glucose 4-epimerase GalE [Ancylobacter sonchi]|uniref:UDP-glucose 4-epimerase GalE n=1 Tax=Ancylobacter sonchi TaxID=1937790 RepID=UPI001BD6DCC8|nr:UDP-glucose 4-epimerase GalE [Ancylobacter sonchi]MBS7536743.1 UDP-glucose 4-epimerase GalE [Ancylobacter sonchi]